MRLLLAHNSLYYPAFGGGDKSNRLLMEALSARGHECRVVARVNGFGPEEHERFLNELAARSLAPSSVADGVVTFNRNSVEVHTVTSHANLRAYFAGQITAFEPDIILVSTDDPAQLLLEAALRAGNARVAYLARATLAVPFGPDCAFPSEAKTAVLRQVDGAVGVSQYVAEYIRKWSGIPAIHVPISLPDAGPYPLLGRFENEFVLMVNPCAVKGIVVFLELAARMPELQFAAVPTWGADAKDLESLRAMPNVTILPPVDDMNDLLARTRVLLVPSLWAEARSRVIVEAMVRGVPVIASNVGGVPEAKMGVPYLLPVHPIEHYHSKLDAQMVPIAQTPPQEVGPWLEALRRLTTEREHFEDIAAASRNAALEYSARATVAPFEHFLQEMLQAPKRAHSLEPARERLSPEKRRLLELRLRQKASAGSWFGKLDAPPAAMRLFCFPYAGAGASAYRDWQARLGTRAEVAAARLPGRESRASEPAIDRMEALVSALLTAIEPHLTEPFAFFGHSMGAMIAFELARALRRKGLPAPARLFVSGARAPQLLMGRQPGPEPTDEALKVELRTLGGSADSALDNEELMQMILPALRADSALYRHYEYRQEAPLTSPIDCFGGLADPRINQAQFAAWREQTSAGFRLRMLPGGHFFQREEPEAFWQAFLEALETGEAL